MKRKDWQKEKRDVRVHNCSASVCKNASNQPFKYLCKYFELKPSQETLALIESALNNFSAVEQGKHLLIGERGDILHSIKRSVPFVIYEFRRKRLIRELGFKPIDLTDLYFPAYQFSYVSAGGNSSSMFEIKFDLECLERFILYIGNLVKFRNSAAGQRALMTSSLREKIKVRDRYSCRICKISVTDEAHLLLEIDHIVPVSKGGITSEENLQTLCWRCNRSKGEK